MPENGLLHHFYVGVGLIKSQFGQNSMTMVGYRLKPQPQPFQTYYNCYYCSSGAGDLIYKNKPKYGYNRVSAKNRSVEGLIQSDNDCS